MPLKICCPLEMGSFIDTPLKAVWKWLLKPEISICFKLSVLSFTVVILLFLFWWKITQRQRFFSEVSYFPSFHLSHTLSQLQCCHYQFFLKDKCLFVTPNVLEFKICYIRMVGKTNRQKCSFSRTPQRQEACGLLKN